LRVLISTFGKGDLEKILLAMRRLPYDRLVLMGGKDAEESDDFKQIQDLEAMVDHEVGVETVDEDGFMTIVNDVSDILQRHILDPKAGTRNEVRLNISGGNKILGDAALFAAFRTGVEAYHCDARVVRLPVIREATAVDKYTPNQVRFIAGMGDGWETLTDVRERMTPAIGRSATDRVIRELRKGGLLQSEVRSGEVHLSLTEDGEDVSRSIQRVGKG
jgi:hypothetical protein